MTWIKLSELTLDGQGTSELMAAACFDGIGVIVRWTWNGNKWLVEAIDTENREMEEIIEDVEGDVIPLEPPTYLITA
jgi:hypothetical protein